MAYQGGGRGMDALFIDRANASRCRVSVPTARFCLCRQALKTP
ncbi:MAG: hypothetical protein ACLRX5_04775 [Slackia sp.]